MATSKSVTVKQVKSETGTSQRQRATLRGLGLRGINSSKTLADSVEVRGMITKVQHLITVEEQQPQRSARKNASAS